MVRRALIFGHSFIHRLHSFTLNNRHRGWLNLGLDGTDIQVEFYGQGGGTLRPGPKCIQRQQSIKIISDFKPHCVFLQIGGNDLAGESDPAKLARDIVSFADYIITCYQVRHVVVGQLLPRYSGEPEVNYAYNEKVYNVNNTLQRILCTRNDITYWSHRGLWKNTPDLLLNDLVHLNQEGLEIYARNVRAAVGSRLRC